MRCHNSTKLIIESLGSLSVAVAEWLRRPSTDLKIVGSTLKGLQIKRWTMKLIEVLGLLTFRTKSEMRTAAPQHRSGKWNVNVLNNILKLVRLASSFSYRAKYKILYLSRSHTEESINFILVSFSYRGKYKILYLSRSHTEESIKIYTCLVFISRKV